MHPGKCLVADRNPGGRRKGSGSGPSSSVWPIREGWLDTGAQTMGFGFNQRNETSANKNRFYSRIP